MKATAHIPRPSDHVKRSPMFTLHEFAVRKNMDPAAMVATYSHCPADARPKARNVAIFAKQRYSLSDLERWWRVRPINLFEAAKRLGTTYYLLKLAVAAAGLSPVAQVQRRSDQGPDTFYRMEDLQLVWSQKNAEEPA
jgi:hypothetical protein